MHGSQLLALWCCGLGCCRFGCAGTAVLEEHEEAHIILLQTGFTKMPIEGDDARMLHVASSNNSSQSEAAAVYTGVTGAVFAALQTIAEDLHSMGRASPHKAVGAEHRAEPIALSRGLHEQQVQTDTSNSMPLPQTFALFSAVACLVGTMVFLAPSKEASKDSEEASQTPKPPQWWKTPFFIAAWMTLSGGLTIFNKWLFIPTGGNFPHVATLTWCHMVASTLLTQILRYTQPKLFPAVTRAQHSWIQLAQLVLPVAYLQPFTLVLGNKAYLYLSVSYIQMIKAAMPGMVFTISSLVGLDKFTWHEAGLLFLMTLGVCACTHGELAFSWVGFSYQMSSFFVESLRLISLKLLVSSGSALDPLSALFYVAPCQVLALAGPMLLEVRTFPFDDIFELRYVLAANCLTAFGLNIAGVCLMSLASAVTFTVCGLVKDFALIIGSTLVFGNILTHEELFGAIVVVGAATVFQRFQKTKNAQKDAK